MTPLDRQAETIAQAVVHMALGETEAVRALLDEFCSTAEGMFGAAYALARLVAEAGDGDGFDIEADLVAGDGLDLAATLVAAAVNDDADGAAHAFYGAEALSAAGSIYNLLAICGALLRTDAAPG